jgi:hypothetical protein
MRHNLVRACVPGLIVEHIEHTTKKTYANNAANSILQMASKQSAL